MDNKRLAIFFALSAGILILWSVLFPPAKPPQRSGVPTPVAAASTPGPGTTTGAAAAAPPPPAAAEEPAATEPARSVAPVIGREEKVVTVTMPYYEARLTNRGAGALVSFVLRTFRDGEGKPLDVVRHGGPFPGRTLTLDPVDPFTSRAAAALAVVETEKTERTVTVRFRYREANGEELVRTWGFGPGYLAAVQVERSGRRDAPVALVLGPGMGNQTAEEMKAQQFTRPGSLLALLPGGSVERKAKDAVKDAMDLGKGLASAGLEDNYFMAAFLPGRTSASSAFLPAGPKGSDASSAAGARVRPVKLDETGPDGKVVPQQELEVVLSANGRLESELFFGPKDLEVLRTLRPGMDKLIDYGWFAVLVRPLLWGLRAIHSYVGNWGVAIILITFCIKLLLYPLTHQQLVSMKKMSKMQPKMEAVRAKYAAKIKQDPQARVKMNEEVMRLYKSEGVNPAAGCFPLLLQMPILIAFYRMLQHSIELRHAPFVLWITDLSAKDPYYVTPILMTLTMWFQQQTTPAAGDPTQRKIMAMMPFVFGFLFKDAPAGLVLYWLVQNILTIVQQAILNRYTDLGPAALKESKPA